LFFQPFPTQDFEFDNKQLFIAGFGVIVFITQVIIQIIFQKHLIRSESSEEENTILNSLYYFSMVVLSGTAFVFYIQYVGHTQITFNTVVRVIIICLSLPVTIHLKNSFALLHVKHKSLLQENRMMQDKLKHFSENYASRLIELNSENEADNLRILVSEVVFVKAADNYVEVGYMDGGEFKKKMIRNTLKNIESQLTEFNNFIRTHRSSIFNIQYISRLHKNFNAYWLTINNSSETIPVSRQYLLTVKDLL